MYGSLTTRVMSLGVTLDRGTYDLCLGQDVDADVVAVRHHRAAGRARPEIARDDGEDVERTLWLGARNAGQLGQLAQHVVALDPKAGVGLVKEGLGDLAQGDTSGKTRATAGGAPPVCAWLTASNRGSMERSADCCCCLHLLELE